jgi:hypothetical protein
MLLKPHTEALDRPVRMALFEDAHGAPPLIPADARPDASLSHSRKVFFAGTAAKRCPVRGQARERRA